MARKLDDDGLLYRIISAVVLGLAAVTTGWAAYQSAVWSGQHSVHLALANRADRQASELEIEANQIRLLDAGLFEGYATALLRGDQRTAAFYKSHFRPELAAATAEWLKSAPPDHPGPRRHPLEGSRYRLRQDADSRRERNLSDEELQSAHAAEAISSSYVLGTVIAAFVGLFAGMSETSPQRRGRRLLSFFAIGVYALAAFWILTRPITITGQRLFLAPPPEPRSGQVEVLP